MSITLNNQEEKQRVIAVYAGIFPDDIQGFVEALQKRSNRPKKNYSR